MAAPGPSFRGFWRDLINNRFGVYHGATEIVRYTATGISHLVALAVTGGVTATTGSFTAPAGNVVLGTPGTFASTQGVAMVKMGGSSLGGTAPAGAIATAGGVFASDTVVKKIIADGTVSNVET